MKYLLVTLICVSMFFSFFVLPSGIKNIEAASSLSSPGNSAIVAPNDIRLKNVNFSVSRIEKDFAIMKAEFDLESSEEVPGELYIDINGKYPANGRLLIRKGIAHYSMDFYLPNPDLRLLKVYMADVTLKSRGRINDSVSSQFAVVSYSATVR
jgi:hypothetical protein